MSGVVDGACLTNLSLNGPLSSLKLLSFLDERFFLGGGGLGMISKSLLVKHSICMSIASNICSMKCMLPSLIKTLGMPNLAILPF